MSIPLSSPLPGQTLTAVTEGLAVALAAGTVVGFLMRRSAMMGQIIRHYVNDFYAIPMFIVLPLFSRWFRSIRTRMLVEVVLPAATPYLLARFRLAAGRALIGAVVAEFFLSVGGLGYYILFNSRTDHHKEASVGVLLLAGFGVGFEVLV